MSDKHFKFPATQIHSDKTDPHQSQKKKLPQISPNSNLQLKIRNPHLGHLGLTQHEVGPTTNSISTLKYQSFFLPIYVIPIIRNTKPSPMKKTTTLNRYKPTQSRSNQDQTTKLKEKTDRIKVAGEEKKIETSGESLLQ